MNPVSAATELFGDADFQAGLREAAAEAGKAQDKAEKYARKCLREIEATPKESWLRPAAKMARFIYTLSLIHI